MSDLISRQAAIDDIRTMIPKDAQSEHKNGQRIDWEGEEDDD